MTRPSHHPIVTPERAVRLSRPVEADDSRTCWPIAGISGATNLADEAAPYDLGVLWIVPVVPFQTSDNVAPTATHALAKEQETPRRLL